MYLQSYAEEAKGSELRAEVYNLLELIRDKRLAEAERIAYEISKKYESSFNPNVLQYTFQSNEDYQEFKRASTLDFEWIDWGYKECLQMQAFIAAERRDFASALPILQGLEKVAPMSAGTAVERGYIQNQMGDPSGALSAYKRALEISHRYQSQRQYQAAALRGIGYALVELKRLDEAERAYQDSLKIEPNNPIAQNELAYIRELQKKRAGRSFSSP